MKNRIELAKYFAELGFKVGAEVGVAFGYYSEVLCKHIPGLKLYAIDSWDTLENDKREKKNGIKGEDAVRKALAPYNAILIKKTSMEAVKDFADESLDFVFIDADHSYECVKEDVREWSKKVRSGGIVSGHDYYVFKGSGNRGVLDAVNEYAAEHGLALQRTRIDRSNPVRDDRQPSWYFVKK